MTKITATPADGVNLLDVNTEALAALEAEVLDERGRQTMVPAATYAKYDLGTRCALCVKHALYGLVTTELVGFIREHIADRRAIEVGSGDGVLAAALGIRATDNHMQTWAPIRKEYAKMMQPTIKYGPNVENVGAAEAVNQYEPQVIVASWLTHLYRPEEHERGGSMYAADERVLLANCETLIFFGNTSAHAKHRLWNQLHQIYEADWMYSRAVRGKNFVGVWTGGKA